MKRNTLNFVIDFLSFLVLLGMVFTGVVMKWILPPGSGGRGRELHGGRGGEHIKDLWGLTRHEWGEIHFYLAVGFVALMLVHIILHWGWIKNFFKGLFRRKPKTGVGIS